MSHLPIRSMTGYARVRKSTVLGEVVFSLKSVNHRGLDLQFNMPSLLDPFEAGFRSILKKNLARGHVELRVHVERTRSGKTSFNQELMESYLAAYREAAEAHGVVAPPDLNTALRLPGMLVEAPAAEPGEALEQELSTGMKETCQLLNEFREREGRELVADMKSRQEKIASHAKNLENFRTAAVNALKKRLEDRLAELEVKVEPQRLAQEVALLVDRSDIAEEISRLNIHVVQLGELLEKGGEVGKKLDFLLQELNRETNTMLSKTANAGEPGMEISGIALGIKAEIEKIREQSLNVE